jgi:hypothetical protein
MNPPNVTAVLTSYGQSRSSHQRDRQPSLCSSSSSHGIHHSQGTVSSRIDARKFREILYSIVWLWAYWVYCERAVSAARIYSYQETDTYAIWNMKNESVPRPFVHRRTHKDDGGRAGGQPWSTANTVHKIIIYLMQQPHLLVRQTSCSTVTIEHGYWVTSQSCNATDIDIHRPHAINKTQVQRVSRLFCTDTLCCDHSKLQAFLATDIRDIIVYSLM